MLKKPGPRMLFRTPDWPARVSIKSPYWPRCSPGAVTMVEWVLEEIRTSALDAGGVHGHADGNRRDRSGDWRSRSNRLANATVAHAKG